MSTVQSIQSTLVNCPLEATAVFATRRVAARQFLLIRVVRDDGTTGIGATYCGDQGGELCHQAVKSLLAPVVVGRDSFATEALWQAMYQESLLQGRTGSVMRALAAIDIALWDCNARSAGLPLWKYLGAYHEGSVPAYASGGYYKDSDDEKGLAEEMAGYCDMGFDAMKMKVGRATPSVDCRRVAIAREVLGEDRHLMLDANNTWRNVPEAMRFLNRVAPYDPFWIEEPFSPDDIDNHARLAQVSPVPVATGEIESGRWRFREMIRREAVAFLQPDVFACGGITEWRRIAAHAAACGIPVCTHAWQEFHAPLVASVPNGLYVEYFTDQRIVNLQQLIDEPVSVKDGRVVLGDAPGYGFDFNEEAVDRLAVIPWEEMRGAR